jgi:hypothetical protein
MGEAAELSAQLAGLDGPMGMNVPGIDNRQMALNIMHLLSGLREPQTIDVTARVTGFYRAPPRRKPFRRLWFIIPRRLSAPACVGSREVNHSENWIRTLN